MSRSTKYYIYGTICLGIGAEIIINHRHTGLGLIFISLVSLHYFNKAERLKKGESLN